MAVAEKLFDGYFVNDGVKETRVVELWYVSALPIGAPDIALTEPGLLPAKYSAHPVYGIATLRDRQIVKRIDESSLYATLVYSNLSNPTVTSAVSNEVSVDRMVLPVFRGGGSPPFYYRDDSVFIYRGVSRKTVVKVVYGSTDFADTVSAKIIRNVGKLYLFGEPYDEIPFLLIGGSATVIGTDSVRIVYRFLTSAVVNRVPVDTPGIGNKIEIPPLYFLSEYSVVQNDIRDIPVISEFDNTQAYAVGDPLD